MQAARIGLLGHCDALLLVGTDNARAVDEDLIVVGRGDRQLARAKYQRYVPCGLRRHGRRGHRHRGAAAHRAGAAGRLDRRHALALGDGREVVADGEERRGGGTMSLDTAASDVFAVTLPVRPYPGLRPFGKDEWPIFFGREQMIDDVVGRLVRQRLLVVHGDSGCGKSSLIRAGVLPRLEQDTARGGRRWVTRVMTTGRRAARPPGRRPGRHPGPARPTPGRAGCSCAAS